MIYPLIGALVAILVDLIDVAYELNMTFGMRIGVVLVIDTIVIAALAAREK